jgi:probable HAF family extracellular repeat protein
MNERDRPARTPTRRRGRIAAVTAGAVVASVVPMHGPSVGASPRGEALEFPTTWSHLEGAAFAGQSSEALAVNDDGLVAGVRVSDDLISIPWVFDTVTGEDQALPRIGTDTYVEGMNNEGVVVGRVSVGAGATEHGWLWDPDTGDTTDLTEHGFPAGQSVASGINDAGIVVGGARPTGEEDTRPFRFDPETGDVDWLSAPPGGFATATDISADGTIVGQAMIGLDTHAVLWDAETLAMTDLGTLPGHLVSYASAINDSGTLVVGSSSETGEELPTAFVYDVSAETMTGIVEESLAEGVNDDGLVVGDHEAEDGSGYGFIYDVETDTFHAALPPGAFGAGHPKDVIFAVNALRAINNEGFPVGWAQFDTGVMGIETHAGVLGTWTFTDVPPWERFVDEIEWAAASDITNGYPDDSFRPRRFSSRQAMSAFLYRLAGSPPFTPPATPTFDDVPSGHPFYAEIEWMVAEGIVAPDVYPDGFHPGAPTTRQAMAAYLYRLAGSPGFVPPAPPTFDDVSSSHPFFLEIEWLAAEGITTGFDDGGYHPASKITRQAVAAMLFRYASSVPSSTSP